MSASSFEPWQRRLSKSKAPYPLNYALRWSKHLLNHVNFAQLLHHWCLRSHHVGDTSSKTPRRSTRAARPPPRSIAFHLSPTASRGSPVARRRPAPVKPPSSRRAAARQPPTSDQTASDAESSVAEELRSLRAQLHATNERANLASRSTPFQQAFPPPPCAPACGSSCASASAASSCSAAPPHGRGISGRDGP